MDLTVLPLHKTSLHHISTVVKGIKLHKVINKLTVTKPPHNKRIMHKEGTELLRLKVLNHRMVNHQLHSPILLLPPLLNLNLPLHTANNNNRCNSSNHNNNSSNMEHIILGIVQLKQHPLSLQVVME